METCATARINIAVSYKDIVLDAAVFQDSDAKLQEKFKGKIFSLCGLPGSGKGTQAGLLSKRLGLIHISTGDLFREEVKRDTPTGKIIGEYMAAGQFVPREYANKILADRLSEADTLNGVLLDGFPRNIDHLEDLDDILSTNKAITLAGCIYLDVDENEVVARIAGRRMCPSCNSVYHISFQPPLQEGVCDSCGTTLTQRTDDTVETVKVRVNLAKEGLSTLLDEFYRRDQFLLHIRPDSSPLHLCDKIIELLSYPERRQQLRSACAKLQLQLQNFLNLLQSTPVAEAKLAKLIEEFRDLALIENAAKRTGSMRRFVYVITSNDMKLSEFIRIFDLYGVEVIQVTPPPNGKDDNSVAAHEIFTNKIIPLLLQVRTKLLVPIAVMSEETCLLKPIPILKSTGKPAMDPLDQTHRELSSMLPGVFADHLSTLKVWSWQPSSNSVISQQYKHCTQGRMRNIISDRSFHWGEPVFGWDDRFEVLATGKTYQEHRTTGLKISSRDMVISSFLEDYIYYKHGKTLQHSDVTLQRPVDFNVDVAAFVHSQHHYNSTTAAEFGLCDALHHVLNEGIFFKAADTRIEANYWQPGLNAGLPLISKKDPIHELTFMFHDFGHFLMKDLIFTGSDSPLHRQVYIASRMISEAATIMLADGVFVDTLRREGVNYDFTARKIYPLVQATGLDFSNKSTFVENLHKLMKASVDYTLKGDDSSFIALMLANGVADMTVLEEYKDKFKPFFVSDYQWTAHNYENMSSRANEMREWWRLTEPVRELLDLPLETIDEFITLLPDPNSSTCSSGSSESAEFQVVDQVFDVIFNRRIAPVFQQIIPLENANIRRRRGFLRYMIGQLGIFSRFASFGESESYLSAIIRMLAENASIEDIRSKYEEFVTLLQEKNLISGDDAHNYKDIYPLFEPFYVSYDKDEEYPNLCSLAKKILSREARRGYQHKLAEVYYRRKLVASEQRYFDMMYTMIEAGGGQVEDGVFVTKPGVLLLAHDNAVTSPHAFRTIPNKIMATIQHATFLISGISLETSLELIAHGEAAVARLTSSKTKAMSCPLYRVQGNSLAQQSAVRYLSTMQRFRTCFEAHEDPRSNWSCGEELFNITQPGCKSTAIVYTMSLTDYHKLFIGRSGESGNELEIREVVHTMTAILNKLYPQTILTTDQYLSLSNGAKYVASSSSSSTENEAAVVVEDDTGNSSTVGDWSVSLVSTTILTTPAKNLFHQLNIDTLQSDAHQLSEFRSRITYLAFPKTAQNSSNYIRKMIFEFQHLSIVSACRLTIRIASVPANDYANANKAVTVQASLAEVERDVTLAGGSFYANQHGHYITLNVKQCKKLLAELVCASATSSDIIRKTMQGLHSMLLELLHGEFPFVFLNN